MKLVCRYIVVLSCFAIVCWTGRYLWHEQNSPPSDKPRISSKIEQHRKLTGKRQEQNEKLNFNRPDMNEKSEIGAQHITDVTVTTSSSPRRCTVRRFADPELPVIALASFPGAGNTWVRYLLEQATGIYTGSLYTDSILRQSGFAGEGRTDGSVLVVKTHYPYLITPNRDSELKPSKVILLIRNPFDTLLAKYNLQITGSHTKSLNVSQILVDKAPWVKYLSTTLGFWLYFHKHWLRKKQLQTHVVHYEDIVNDVKLELTKMATFLNVSVSTRTLQCASDVAEGSFHRKKTAELRLLYDILDSHMKQRLDETYAQVLKITGQSDKMVLRGRKH